MEILKSGARLKSAACDTQIMIIKGLAGEHALTCGGAPMSSAATPESSPLDPTQAEGTLMGKRYVNAEETLELLCVKGGQGSLALDGVPLGPKQAKALPSSD